MLRSLMLAIVAIFPLHFGRTLLGQEVVHKVTPPLAAAEQNAPAPPTLNLPDFQPEPRLQVKQTNLQRAKFPAVDVHTHFRLKTKGTTEELENLVAMMDRNQIAVCISLDGTLGDVLDQHKKFLWNKYRDRFVIFCNIDWIGTGSKDRPETWACNQGGFVRNTVEQLKEAHRQGVSGLKLFKLFGLGYQYPDGTLMRIDDPQWDPIWEACGSLGMPILIHTADPSAFFLPIDEKNERWEELSRHPDWSFPSDRFPSRDELLEARNRVIQRHPHTNFIAAHMANDAEDLDQLAKWLDLYPNLYVDTASRISELGRQPYSSREFVIKYADRILFGTDGPWPEMRVRLYWRFFESKDEYFPYSEKAFPPQGFWRIYGLYLPDETLKKVYFQNAARVIPGVSERLESWEKK